MKINLFSKKYNGIFHPFGLESLYHLAIYIKEQNNNKKIKFNELKTIIVFMLKYLLKNEIIFILEPNWMDNKDFNKINLCNQEIINNIYDKLNSSTNIDELYDFYWFKYQDWYRIGLENKGLTASKINWNKFVITEIGDLEQWIEENKPKK